MRNKPVVRIAPSPTGNLHIGTVRTALINFLYARSQGGTFIVRIEDTDKERSKPEYEKDILDGLEKLGLKGDEFFRQSERLELYKEKLAALVERGAVYRSEEKEGERAHVYRFKNPNAPLTFHDLVRGDITFDTTDLGDFIVAKDLDEPLYHFAAVVDDLEMGITHVIRGEEHISNTPRQILILEALSGERPVYAHLPLILAPDRSKLSKRKGATSINEYVAQGYLREAIINYLALLGWNPKTEQEIFTLPELVAAFTLDGIHTSGAIFDTEKLDWVNREHLKRVPDGEFERNVIERIPEYAKDAERFRRALPVIRERISKYGDVATVAEGGELEFLKDAVSPDPAGIPWKDEPKEKAAEHLARVAELLEALPGTPTLDEVKNSVFPYAETAGKGAVLWPMRYALTGAKRSPDPFTVASILGKDESLRRIRHAITLLS